VSDNPTISPIELVRNSGGVTSDSTQDWVAREEPLEIRVRGRSVAITMRTPGHDQELAVGFLVSEGILKDRRHLAEVAHCTTGENALLGNIINVFLAADAEVDFERLTRHVFGSSSCGVCGKASIESVHQHFPPVKSALQIAPALLSSLPAKLLHAQTAFARTGGLHAAGLFDQHGQPIVIREDVGRHNAVDKIIGHAFRHGMLPLTDQILMVSGRASFEILQKALAAAIPIVAAVSAPSSLAVEFARESGQTLLGFVRGDTFNIYSHPGRIISTHA
jgi:FdhD protein